MKKCVFIAIIAILLCITGCSKTEITDNSGMTEDAIATNGDYHNIDAVLEKLPSGDWLKAKYYLNGDLYSYPEVEHAYFYHDEQTEEIDKDDPRLTLLLNLLLKSEEDMTTIVQQSYIEESEIQQCYEAKDPMLEVVFKKSDSKTVRGLLICKDSYLSLLNTETGLYPIVKDGEMLAERKWPFKTLIQDAISEGTVQNIDLSTSWSWGGEKWLDILDYCGFNSTDLLLKVKPKIDKI